MIYRYCLMGLILLFLLSGCGSKPMDKEQQAATSSKLDDIAIHSDALMKDMRFVVYTPPGYDSMSEYPVLYMLYGYGGNRRYVFDNMRLGQIADSLINTGEIAPLLIVSPDYGNSFAVNTVPGQGVDPGGVDEGSYEDYLLNEVISYVDTHYSTKASREARYVGGFSMGGYAALYLGFNHPDLFSKIGGHSAAIWDYTDHDQFTDQRDWLYATEALRDQRDPFRLAESQDLSNLRVYLDVGESDHLIEEDERLYELLMSKKIPVGWHPFPGSHSVSYWTEHFGDYLKFYSGRS